MASGPSPYDFEPIFSEEELENRIVSSSEMEVEEENDNVDQLPGVN